MRRPTIVRRGTAPEHEAAYPPPFETEKLSIGRNLGRAAGTRTLGAWEERLPPGRRTSFTHAHLREEELVYVLAGRPTLRCIEPGGEPQEDTLEPGDFVAFPAGTGVAHTFTNPGPEDALLLVVGERQTGERTHYPEDVAYAAWRGERHPERAWPDVAGPTGEGQWPAVHIETARLVLRPWRATDTPTLWALQNANRDHLGRWMAWARATPTLDEQLATVRSFEAAFAEGRDLVYGLFTPEGRPIGGVGFHPRVGPFALEIGYWIEAAHEGQGLVTEVVAALCQLAFEIKKVQAVEIHCDPLNERSAAVPRRLGFTEVGTLPGRYRDADGQPVASQVHSLTATTWPTVSAGYPACRAWDALGRRLL